MVKRWAQGLYRQKGLGGYFHLSHTVLVSVSPVCPPQLLDPLLRFFIFSFPGILLPNSKLFTDSTILFGFLSGTFKLVWLSFSKTKKKSDVTNLPCEKTWLQGRLKQYFRPEIWFHPRPQRLISWWPGGGFGLQWMLDYSKHERADRPLRNHTSSMIVKQWWRRPNEISCGKKQSSHLRAGLGWGRKRWCLVFLLFPPPLISLNVSDLRDYF